MNIPDKIRKIKEADNNLNIWLHSFHKDESEAYRIENQLIETFEQYYMLTNAVKNVIPSRWATTSLLETDNIFNHIIPFENWLGLRQYQTGKQPGIEEKADYWFLIVEALKLRKEFNLIPKVEQLAKYYGLEQFEKLSKISEIAREVKNAKRR